MLCEWLRSFSHESLDNYICLQFHHNNCHKILYFQYLRDSTINCTEYIFQIAYFTHFNANEANGCVIFSNFSHFLHSFIHSFNSPLILKIERKISLRKKKKRTKMYRNEAYGIPYLSDSVIFMYTGTGTYT